MDVRKSAMPHEKQTSGESGGHHDAAPGELDGVEERATALHDQIAERRARPAEGDTGESTARSGPRRLAPPPWQMQTTIGSREFRERFESEGPGAAPRERLMAAGDHEIGTDDTRPRAPGTDSPEHDDEPRADAFGSAGSPLAQSDWQREPQREPIPPQQWSQVPPLPSPPPGWLPPPPPGWLPPPEMAPTFYGPPPGFRAAPPSLDEAEVVHRAREAPHSGWRRTVHRASAGRINPGESRKEREAEDLLAQIRQPLVGDFRIAVLSIKGGVGKTTTTLGLGSALAMTRNDRVIAVDANPDRGTLAERVRDRATESTVRDLLSDPNLKRYADVRVHTRMASSRLEVLASEQDPAVSEVFGEADYRRTVDILRQYYNIVLTDCGTGIMHSAMTGVLDLAHAIVLVSSPAIDAARSASATLDWLMQHGHSALVREAHVVLSASRPGSAALKLNKVFEHFEARCRSVHLIPFDPHLAEGADIDFDLLKPATLQAYLELAGAVAEKFRWLGGRHRQ
jgi:MinD-like ATPase involved in chromosome partitioning or flagellar assembly